MMLFLIGSDMHSSRWLSWYTLVKVCVDIHAYVEDVNGEERT